MIVDLYSCATTPWLGLPRKRQCVHVPKTLSIVRTVPTRDGFSFNFVEQRSRGVLRPDIRQIEAGRSERISFPGPAR